jgi:hypothetical protein
MQIKDKYRFSSESADSFQTVKVGCCATYRLPADWSEMLRGNRTASLLLFAFHARQLQHLSRVDFPSRNSWPAAYLSAAI